MAQEGKIVRNKRTGELGIVQGGVVVPYNQQQGSGAVFMPEVNRVRCGVEMLEQAA